MQEDWNIILSVLESPDQSNVGQQKVFSTSPITLGRVETSDFVITDPSASRNHAIIRITNDYTRVFINDSSSYGTEVSGKKLPKGPGSGFTLNNGDIIKIGNTSLRFELKLKSSVQSTFVGQMDRSFLDESPPQSSATFYEKKEVSELPEEPLHVMKTKKDLNPLYIGIIIVCIAVLVYIIFFA